MGLNKIPGAFALVLALAAGCEPRPWETCEQNEDCVVYIPNREALRRGQLDAYCADDERCGCDDGEICICPYYTSVVAACRRGRCVVGDLHELGLTACSRDSDCAGADASCCPSGGFDCTTGSAPAGTVVNVGHLGTLTSIVCNDEPSCTRTSYPGARCVEGRCQP